MTEQNEDFVSFEKALRELKMQSEELKKLVSEGEIRAFRDGQSMKFKREDVEGLVAGDSDADELVFADALEDDTGMVTEELTEEETLLAEDDFEEPEERPARRATPTATPSRRARIEMDEPEHEPGWVTAMAVVGALVLVYGLMVFFNIASEQAPSGLTSLFAKQ